MSIKTIIYKNSQKGDLSKHFVCMYTWENGDLGSHALSSATNNSPHISFHMIPNRCLYVLLTLYSEIQFKSSSTFK